MRIWTRAIAATLVAAAMLTAACIRTTELTMLMDARGVAADLHVQFSRAVDQSGQAVLAESDADATASARAATAASASVTRDIATLRSLLEQARFTPESTLLRMFSGMFDEYRRLETEILQLAGDNTNSKARRLAFGTGREAADAFAAEMERIAPSDRATADPRVDALAARAVAAVREVQALEPRHIAEADDGAMTKMEEEILAAEARANAALSALSRMHRTGTDATMGAARASLDRFSAVNKEIVALSRRNSGVRSISLSVGKKRVLAAECDDVLRQIEEALAGRDFPATR